MPTVFGSGGHTSATEPVGLLMQADLCKHAGSVRQQDNSTTGVQGLYDLLCSLWHCPISQTSTAAGLSRQVTPLLFPQRQGCRVKVIVIVIQLCDKCKMLPVGMSRRSWHTRSLGCSGPLCAWAVASMRRLGLVVHHLIVQLPQHLPSPILQSHCVFRHKQTSAVQPYLHCPWAVISGVETA